MAAAKRITPDPGGLPADPGAYALVIEFDRPCRLAIATLAPATLAAGRYLYLGSARGPGGIRARVARHLRRDKTKHWHVDHLTARGRIAGVITAPGGSECALARVALKFKSVAAPVAGFGSSDCRICPAHLLRLPDAPDAVLRALEKLAVKSINRRKQG